MRGSLLIALWVLGALGSSARAQVLWRGDQDLDLWAARECGGPCVDSQGAPVDRFRVVEAPELKGQKALRIELRQKDLANGGVRNELVGVRAIGGGMTLFAEGDERVFSWSTYFPREFPHPHPATPSWHVFFQLRHESHQKLWSPPLAMTLNKVTRSGHEDYEIRLRSAQQGGAEPDDLWKTPIARGKWHRFVLRVRFSEDPERGLVELWHDGQRVYGPVSRATLYAGEPSYVKQGLYRDSKLPADWVEVVYQQGVVISGAVEDVRPRRPVVAASIAGQLAAEAVLQEKR